MVINPFKNRQFPLQYSGRTLTDTQDDPTVKLLAISIIALILASAIILLLWQTLPPQVPLFYTKPWGEEQLATPSQLFLPLLLAGIFLLTNTILAQILSSYTFIKKSLTLGASLACLLSAITIIRIAFLIS